MVRPDFQPMRVPEEPVCIDLFRQNPVFTSLHLKYPVHVVPLLEIEVVAGENGGFRGIKEWERERMIKGEEREENKNREREERDERKRKQIGMKREKRRKG